jgi:adenylate cyclase
MTRRALKCAIDLHRGVQRWISSLPPAVGSQLGFKIGAHFGPIVASRLGESHQHITATGDTVNVASRLMEVAARNEARLALTDTLLHAADFEGAPDGVLSGPLLTQVRGRSGFVTVWFWRDQDKPSRAATRAEMID